jgi:hypothetical protein
MLEHIPQIYAGYSDRQKTYSWTFGANEKGGIKAPEFRKYVLNIRHIFPDCADVGGKRIMLKVDSGPGRSHKEFLAWCRARGIIVYPGYFEHNSSIARDGPILPRLQNRLLRESCCACGAPLEDDQCFRSAAHGTADYGMLIFGGKEESLELLNLFAQYFSIKKMKHFWEKVGAVPLTRRCLLSPQVQPEIEMRDGAINLTADPQATHLATILAKNNDKLCSLGYKGNLFRVELKIRESSKQGRITAENSSERREALAKARSAGVHFKVTGGDYLTSEDDMMIGYELVEREEEIAKLESQKKDALGAS